jgi:hypothetical protein
VSAGRGRAERLRSFGRETWAPYLADTLLRVFASASISGQLGRFTRPFLDYTAGSVRPSSFLVSLWGSDESILDPLSVLWTRSFGLIPAVA